MHRSKICQLSYRVSIALMLLSCTLSQATYGQGATTLRDPLIPGYQETPPFLPPAGGLPPAFGNGPVPRGITPGMLGAPPALPWVPAVPANDIDILNSGVGLPVSPAIATPPGTLGPALTGLVPSAPSVLGAAPPPIHAPLGYNVPSNLDYINPLGGLPGTGGYYTTITKQRRGGQQTHQWEERGLHSVYGGGGNAQDEVTLLGPLAGSGVPYGEPTGVGYNKGPAGSNNDLRYSTIDLGGGQRMKVGGVKVSTGSSLQDYGLSDMRNQPIGALSAHQSTDFGQGFRGMPVYSNKTTDFGLPYKQFNPANVGPQKTGQLLLPTAVETNY